MPPPHRRPRRGRCDGVSVLRRNWPWLPRPNGENDSTDPLAVRIRGASLQFLRQITWILISGAAETDAESEESEPRGMSESGVRRDKAAFSSGCKSHPATAPDGSNRSSY